MMKQKETGGTQRRNEGKSKKEEKRKVTRRVIKPLTSSKQLQQKH